MSPLFALCSTGAWVSTAMVLISKNPVHSVFYLVLVFIHASGLLCLLGLEYFALLQLLVYVGALAVMFLFVVMLLDIPATEIIAHQRGTYPVAGILLISLILLTWLTFIQPGEERSLTAPLLPWIGKEDINGALGSSALYKRAGGNNNHLTGRIANHISGHISGHTIPLSFGGHSWNLLAIASRPVAQLGVALYAIHVDLLIIASLVLLVAMVGAVALTLKRRVQSPVHDVFAQHHRDFQKVICQIKTPSA